VRKIELEAKIINCLFMGGANKQAELRTQSFNGVFRYWFRLAGGSLEDEKRLFGWGGEGAVKGLVSIFLRQKDLNKKRFEKIFDNKGYPKTGYGINYLGFSLDQRFKKTQQKERRECIKENQEFKLEIRFSPLATDKDIKKFLCSVWLAFNLGNFGTRSRRGFGSISIKDISGDLPKEFNLKFKPFESFEEWLSENLNEIKQIIDEKPRADIPFIFDKDKFAIYKVKKENFKNWKDWLNEVQRGREGKYLLKNWSLNKISTPTDLLDFMGFLLAAYRSYYLPDYKNVKKAITSGSMKKTSVERIIFGLPLNFYFSGINKKEMINLKINRETVRRASPLLIKIFVYEDMFEGLFMIMKSKFMPDKAKIDLNGKDVIFPGWKAIDDFIRSLEKNNLIIKIY